MSVGAIGAPSNEVFGLLISSRQVAAFDATHNEGGPRSDVIRIERNCSLDGGVEALVCAPVLRGNIKGLEKQTQNTFLHSVQDNYRILANLLISQGRLPEAQQILGMLKDEEYFEFVRRDASEVAALSQQADLTSQEQKAFAEYTQFAGNITSIANKQSALKAKLKALPEGASCRRQNRLNMND